MAGGYFSAPGTTTSAVLPALPAPGPASTVTISTLATFWLISCPISSSSQPSYYILLARCRVCQQGYCQQNQIKFITQHNQMQAQSSIAPGSTPSKPRTAHTPDKPSPRNATSPHSRLLSPAGRLPQPPPAPRKTTYSTTHGRQEQGLSIYYNQLTPGQIHMKSLEQLEYQNSVLLQQLQQRDQIIRLLKSGWQPSNLPINQQLIRSLNLQLAQKNILIQQFHRGLAQLDQTIHRQNLQLDALCLQHFHNLQALITRHEHYPILIKQTLIQTSRPAQTIYIKDMTVIQEYILRLEETYKEVAVLRERLVVVERDNVGLRQQLERQQHEGSSSVQQQITVYQQQITVYEQQITVLKTEIHHYQQQITTLHGQVSTLRGQLSNSNNNGTANAQLQHQVAGLRQQISLQLTEISTYRQQIGVYGTEIAAYKKQINVLEGDISKYRQGAGGSGRELQELRQQIEGYLGDIADYKHKVSTLTAEVTTYRQQISALNTEISTHRQQINLFNTEISTYKQQISVLNTEISTYKQRVQKYQLQREQLKPKPKDQNTNRQEILRLQEQISLHMSEVSVYKQKMQALNSQISKYTLEMSTFDQRTSNYRLQITTLNQQVSGYKQKVVALNQQISTYRLQISSLNQQIEYLQHRQQPPITNSQAYLQQISSLKRQISSLNSTLHQDSLRYNDQIQSLSTLGDKLRRDNKNYQLQLAQLKQQLQAYEQEVQGLRRKNEGLQSEHYSWELDIAALRRENQRHRADIARHREQQSALTDQNARLQQQLSRMRIKLNRLDSDAGNQALQWKTKYEQSQTIIRRLRSQAQALSLQITQKQEWRTKYENLELRYRNMQQEAQYASEETQQMRSRLEQQEARLRVEIESTLSIEITRRVEAQWSVKLNSIQAEIRRVQAYNQQLLQQIQQLQAQVRSLQHRLASQPTQPTVNVSEYQLKIALLSQQLTLLTSQAQQHQLDMHQAQQYIAQLQSHVKNMQQSSSTHLQDSSTTINTLNLTIEQLTIEIKQYIRKISQTNRQKEDLEIKYKRLDEIYTTTREDLELTINRLNDEIIVLKAELRERSLGNGQWDKEKRELVQRYELELKERWEQLNKSEEYINTYTKQSQGIIAYLQERIRQLQLQLDQHPHGQSQRPEQKQTWLYKIDSRYSQIRSRLLSISSQASHSLTTQSQYWQSYKTQRHQQLQLLQQTIKQSLNFMSEIDQAIVIKREELYRLDFTKLDAIIGELEKLQRTKGQLQGAARRDFESKFYGVLQAVSTHIQQ